MNPRLSREWLLYLVSVGARRGRGRLALEDRPRAPPGRLRAVAAGLDARTGCAGLSVPLLGLLATVNEPMGWDTTAETLRPFLPPEAEIVSYPETGHFLHIERPREVADRVLGFLAR